MIVVELSLRRLMSSIKAERLCITFFVLALHSSAKMSTKLSLSTAYSCCFSSIRSPFEELEGADVVTSDPGPDSEFFKSG